VSDEDSFAVTERNRLRRLHERGAYDRKTVFEILDAGIMCHVAYVLEGQPFCTPTIYWRQEDVLYWHGSSASRMLRHLKPGSPACLTVSHLDALVLARSGFNHSANYRSAMCFGTARLIEDEAEKAAALIAVVDRFYPERAATLRPVSAQESKATTVIKMKIEDASAKIAGGNVEDEPEDYAHQVWAGIIPVRTVLQGEIPCPRLAPDIARPATLEAYRDGRALDEALAETHQRFSAEPA
jgi:nitroimidazol reductase NimA-like FMN-containing flavoprotein (pyridoxamine 5'-phosphate oxidase superfamily)